jgi:hypothetical protein
MNHMRLEDLDRFEFPGYSGGVDMEEWSLSSQDQARIQTFESCDRNTSVFKLRKSAKRFPKLPTENIPGAGETLKVDMSRSEREKCLDSLQAVARDLPP